MLINLIDTNNKFKRILSDLKKVNYISIDTESDGLYHYEENLCLMQIESKRVIYIIDTLKLNIDAIKEILENENIEKIFHSASSDVSLIKKYIDCRINNIFDTMVASKYIFKKAYSLSDLIKKYFNFQINKRYQKINWSKRPLLSEYLKYAAYDVYYLKGIRDNLYIELEKKGFYTQFKKYCQRIANIKPRKREFKLNRYLSIANNYKLNNFEKALFIELIKKREEIAKLKNLPPFRIIDNERLISIVKNKHVNLNCFITDWINEIITNFKYDEKKQEYSFFKKDFNGDYLNRIRILKKWRNEKSEKEEISHELILSKEEIKKIAEHLEINIDLLKNLGIDEERIEKYGKDLISYYNQEIKRC